MSTIVTEEISRKLWEALSRIDQALLEKNGEVLDHSLSTDFIGTIPTGEFFTKQEYIRHHCTPGFGLLTLSGKDDHDTTLRFFGNSAVINRRIHAQYQLPTGIVLEYDVQRTEMFVMEDQEWKMINGQGTRVIPVLQAA
jgi:hypothetical protein